MQHVLTTEQLLQLYKALLADEHACRFPALSRCDACEGEKLRVEAAKLIERILNAECAKGESQ